MLREAVPYLAEQDYQSYKAEEQAVWSELVARRRGHIEQHACREYLDGYAAIGIDQQIPDLEEVSRRLEPLTGWRTIPVSGFLPAAAFFEMLAARQFPATTWLRKSDSLEYTPEPDIFHDVFGHVPMHAHPVFAEFLQKYGIVCARTRDPESVEKLGRVFWYTVEFGLIRQGGEIKIYGSGIVSSHSESAAIIEGKCQVVPFALDQVLETPVTVDQVHQLLFAIESFDQMYEALVQADQRLNGS